MKSVKFWAVSPSMRRARLLKVKNAEDARIFMQGVRATLGESSNDLTICTNECATWFVKNGVVFDNGKFIEK